MICTVKGFSIVSKAEIDIFLELSCFFDDPADIGNLMLSLAQCVLVKLGTFPSPLLSIQYLCIAEYS